MCSVMSAQAPASDPGLYVARKINGLRLVHSSCHRLAAVHQAHLFQIRRHCITAPWANRPDDEVSAWFAKGGGCVQMESSKPARPWPTWARFSWP